MYELAYCSLLLLLCEKKLTTFSKHNIRCEYDVFSRSRHVLILSYRLNILAYTCRPGHACLNSPNLRIKWFIFRKSGKIRNGAAKKPAPGILFLIVSRHADRKCFQKLNYAAVENYMYSHNVALMYQLNRSFNIPPPPPPGIPRAFDVFSCPGGGNLINLIFPGAGIWSLLIGGGEFDR